ncbi:MAG: tetratricopeptide repeat protein [Bacteroidales bacterium]|nr:tetratricopeptide repeat protein [Bacteroidales bacterium]
MKRIIYIGITIVCVLIPGRAKAQIDTDKVMTIGRNALYFEDYLLSIQYFNEVIKTKPYLADPYFYRAVAKFYLEDYSGAEADCSLAIERNPFIVDAYEVRGISRQTLKKDSLAIIDYDFGLKYLPENKTFLLNKAVAQTSVKDYDGAEETFDRVLQIYPKYDNAYLGLASLRLERGDTVGALDRIGKCIELNANNADAFIMRADIMIKNQSDYGKAVDDLSSAITLRPKNADLFVNRAFLKYKLDDYFGAMSDFDYAINLDPNNVTAHLNRGLLRMEVEDNNKAIEDFSLVIDKDPSNIVAVYNRAMLYQKTRQYAKSVADFNRVIEKFPNMSMLYYLRSESKRLMGDNRGGEADYNHWRGLSKKKSKDEFDSKEEVLNDEQEAAQRFKQLVAVENDNSVKPEYANKYRGKVQNRVAAIEPLPMYTLSYYDRPTELRLNSYYQKEVDNINAKNYLRDKLYLTNSAGNLTEEQIKLQFELIRHYTSMIESHGRRPVDYFGRAISHMLVRNFDSAVEDLSAAIRLSPDFALAYFARAMAMYRKSAVEQISSTDAAKSSQIAATRERHDIRIAIADLDKVVELSPNLVYAYYNKGTIYLEHNDFTSAISCFTAAIDLRADFGEAYYNRGIAYMQLGNTERGMSDLSKAGELGIMASYNVLKRMRKL